MLSPNSRRISSSPAFQCGGIYLGGGCVPAGWLRLAGIETWWQWRQVSRQPMELSIIRQGDWVRSGEGYLGTCPSRWAAGADRAAERRDTPRRSRNLWFWHLLRVSVCHGGKRRFFRALSLPLESKSLGFIKEIWLAGRRAQWRWPALNRCQSVSPPPPRR